MAKISPFPMKPTAPDVATQDRWEYTARVRDMLSGQWAQHLEREMAMHIGQDRRAAWGVPDLSSNVLKSVVTQLSVLYDREPNVYVDEDLTGETLEGLLGRDGLVTRAGLWPLMSRVQKLVVGCREYFVRVDVSDHGVNFRPVAPDMVIAEASPDLPDVPTYIQELQLRRHPETREPVWVYEIADIRRAEDGGHPMGPRWAFHLAERSGKMGQDVTQLFTGTADQSGENYPYRLQDGTPTIPWILYHAEKTGQLFDAYNNRELVTGSLTIGDLYTAWLHVVRDCSWPQRYMTGVTIDGLDYEDTNTKRRRAAISMDPASILMLSVDPDATGQPMVGQFQPGGDVESLLQAVSNYETRVAQFSGVSPAEISRANGDPRSGYALSITREGQREAQRRYEPQFRRSDQQLLSITAALVNRHFGTSYPENGYRVQYQSIPLSPNELQAQREDLIAKLGAGLLSPVDAYMALNPGIDRPEAIFRLQEIRAETLSLGAPPVEPDIEPAVEPEDIIEIDAPEADKKPSSSIEAAPELAEDVEKAADTALNGAQVTAAMGIVVAVSENRLPRDAALGMLIEFFNLSPEQARQIMGSVGLSFAAPKEPEPETNP